MNGYIESLFSGVFFGCRLIFIATKIETTATNLMVDMCDEDFLKTNLSDIYFGFLTSIFLVFRLRTDWAWPGFLRRFLCLSLGPGHLATSTKMDRIGRSFAQR